ncbi:hypothetical protein LXL04_014536 [Taraxacum kok-saghyz]
MTHSHSESHNAKTPTRDPFAIKRVDPVGDLWATTNDIRIDTYSFYISWPELTRLQSKICGDKDHQHIAPFESICALVWQCIAKVKCRSNVNTVTICQRDSKILFEGVLTNKAQAIKVIKTDSSAEESNLM